MPVSPPWGHSQLRTRVQPLPSSIRLLCCLGIPNGIISYGIISHGIPQGSFQGPAPPLQDRSQLLPLRVPALPAAPAARPASGTLRQPGDMVGTARGQRGDTEGTPQGQRCSPGSPAAPAPRSASCWPRNSVGIWEWLKDAGRARPAPGRCPRCPRVPVVTWRRWGRSRAGLRTIPLRIRSSISCTALARMSSAPGSPAGVAPPCHLPVTAGDTARGAVVTSPGWGHGWGHGVELSPPPGGATLSPNHPNGAGGPLEHSVTVWGHSRCPQIHPGDSLGTLPMSW